MCDVETVKKIANCLNVKTGKLSVNKEMVVTLNIANNKLITGFATILSYLARESKTEIAQNSIGTRELEAQVYQWIEFAVLYVAPGSKDKHVSKQLLNDFNNLFLSRSYILGNFLTIADLAIFYTIYDTMQTLSPIEKEKYLNLSRWFDHLQQCPQIRQDEQLLNFTTIYVHAWATGTHI